ncbi:MAG: ferrous iron transport protein A [Candidatus Omnitrophica bacterium]|nr:ferrous iron transport protein A [Candidatus Omnitrophota bacterium]
MIISLTDMKRGETGIVVDIEGGFGATSRIQSMGIRIGKEIKKIEANFWRGPQTVLVDKFKVAIGFGIATKILVEVKRDETK